MGVLLQVKELPLRFQLKRGVRIRFARTGKSVLGAGLIRSLGQVDDSLIGQLPEGVTVSRLSAAGSELASLGRLGDFNTALLHDGLKICVNESASLKRPIGLFIADHAADGANVSQVRIEIDVARLGSASFIEYQVSGGDGDLYANVAVDLTLADGASATAFTVEAVPQLGQATKDAKCGTLSITHTGVKSVSGAGTDCW